jgi:Mrp family chromosome partitioning ATPase
VPLRAYYNRKAEGQKAEELEGRLTGGKQSERVVVELEKELESWLNKAKKEDAIRLISGGPGSGKSSFAKMFAAKLAAKGTISVLFIPLHHFEPSDDLIDAVGKFVQMDGILPHNPLAAEHRESRLLIIFDGLDDQGGRHSGQESKSKCPNEQGQKRVDVVFGDGDQDKSQRDEGKQNDEHIQVSLNSKPNKVKILGNAHHCII